MSRALLSPLPLAVFGLMLLLSFAHAQSPGTNAPADAAPSSGPAATATSPDTSNFPSTPATAPLPALSQVTPGQTPAPAQDEIKDIRPPFYFILSLFWVWVALAVLAAVGLLAGLWYFFKPHRQLSAKTAYELTLEKLEQARALLNEENPMPYAVLVSETIRSYLGQRFRTPSTRRTTEEFLRLMETNEGAPLADHRDLLRHFLQACDLVKFARYQPTLTELEEVQQRAVGFVTATKPLAGANTLQRAAV